jgi:hypothetical protein
MKKEDEIPANTPARNSRRWSFVSFPTATSDTRARIILFAVHANSPGASSGADGYSIRPDICTGQSMNLRSAELLVRGRVELPARRRTWQSVMPMAGT